MTNPYQRADADSSSYRGPPPIEVYTLPDAANASIPLEIRTQFQRDDQGRILFFTAPPLARPARFEKGSDATPPLLGHSIRYQAQKARSQDEVAARRKEYESRKAAARAEKRKRVEAEEGEQRERVRKLQRRALEVLQDGLVDGLRADLKALYGEKWSEMVGADLDRIAELQNEASRAQRDSDLRAQKRKDQVGIDLRAGFGMLDD